MSKASAADKGTENKGAAAKGGKGSKAKPARWGEADPSVLYIVGLDEGFREGEPGFNAELFEPDRIREAPSKDFVESLREHGIDPVMVVRAPHPTLGDVLVIAKGRQRTMGARLIAADGKGAISVFYFVQDTSDALDVTRENEFRKRRTALEKANHAARLAKMGKKEAEILSSFSDDGAKQITKMTLINWKRAANCCPAIQARCEAGDFPITVCYEIGKIGYNDKDMTLEDKTSKQMAALAEIEAAGGTLKGKAGRANAGAAADGAGEGSEDEGNGGESGGGGTPGGVTRVKSAKLSPDVLREMSKTFETDEDEEPYTDMLRTGPEITSGPQKGKRALQPSREYVDGDYQKLTGAILAAIVGDDPAGEALQAFPSVFKHVKKYLRDA